MVRISSGTTKMLRRVTSSEGCSQDRVKKAMARLKRFKRADLEVILLDFVLAKVTAVSSVLVRSALATEDSCHRCSAGARSVV